MPPRKVYFEAVRVGDELPVLSKPAIDRVQLARYAGALGDFNPLHVDELHARTAGLPSVLAPGSLAMGFLAQLVTEWARGAIVRRLSARFVRPLWPADTLVCKGRVSDRVGQGGRYHLELEVWAENQRGELVVKGQVTLQVFHSPEDEARARAGQPPLVVEVPRSSALPAPLGAPAVRSPAPVSARELKARGARPKAPPARRRRSPQRPARKAASRRPPRRGAPRRKR